MILGSAELTIPEGVTSETHNPADFQLIEFHYQKEHILTIYAGNWPSFPSPECGKADRKKIALSSFLAFEARCPPGAHLYREVVVQLESQNPHILHFMQPDRRRDLGDAIIKSVKPAAQRK